MYRDVIRALTALAVSVLLLLAVQLKELCVRILMEVPK